MKLVFMGTPAFASVSLNLLAQFHTVSGAVCMPDKPAGRGGKLSVPAVKKTARELSIPVFQPRGNAEIAALLRELKPEAVCVAAYGRILSPEVLALAPRGFINLHASLLPAYRGAAPVNRAVMAGEKKTGVTTMLISEKLDAGDILLRREVAVKDGEDSRELTGRLATEGAGLLVQTFDEIERGVSNPAPQDHSAATYAPALRKEEGRIDWEKTAADIINLIRGTQPWPGAFTYLRGKTLKITRAGLSDGTGKPGEILSARKTFVVAAGEGALDIKEVQIEGKKRMPAKQFLAGARLEASNFLLSSPT